MCSAAAAFGALLKEIEQARNNDRLWFDASTLQLSTPAEYRNFLVKVKRNPPLFKSVRDLLPLSYPAFNFLTADDGSWSAAEHEAVTTGQGSHSIFTDHIIPIYFRLRENRDDRRKDRRLEKWFMRKWNEADDDARYDCAMEAVLPTRGRLINSRSSEAKVGKAFDEVVANPIVDLMQLIIPRIAVVAQYQGTECSALAELEAEDKYSNFRHARSLKVDLALTVPDGELSNALVICEAKTGPVGRLADCLEWALYNQFGCGNHVIEKPTRNEISRCEGIMRQGFGYCFAFMKDKIVIHDALYMHVITFDLESIKVYRSDSAAAREMGRGAKFTEDGGRVAVIDYTCKTVRWDSCDPTLRRQLAMMAVEEYILRKVDLRRRMRRLLEAKDELWETDDSVVRRIYEHRRIREAKEREERGDRTWNPSSVTGNVDSLSFSTIQDGDYINKVVRMSMEESSRNLPNVKGDCKEVVIKMLDFFNVEMYYNSVSKADVGYLSMDDFKQHCVKGFADEVDSYLRMEKYANPEIAALLHTPRMLDYGSCCIHDDKGHTLEGYYLVLEFLDGTKCLPTQGELDDAVQALGTMGIIHTDMAERNWIQVGETKFLIDFNHVKLLKIDPQVAVGVQ